MNVQEAHTTVTPPSQHVQTTLEVFNVPVTLDIKETVNLVQVRGYLLFPIANQA